MDMGCNPVTKLHGSLRVWDKWTILGMFLAHELKSSAKSCVVLVQTLNLAGKAAKVQL
jgi:hypothetical protein